MSFPNSRTYPFDANNLLSDNAAAYTATGYSQVGGAQAVFDTGGNQAITTPAIQVARIDAVAVCDITAIKTSSGNETYKLILVGSNSASFASNNVMLGEVELGAASDVLTPFTSVTGRVEIPFTNEQCGTIYEYVALYIVIGGTTPTINIEAFVAVTGEP